MTVLGWREAREDVADRNRNRGFAPGAAFAMAEAAAEAGSAEGVLEARLAGARPEDVFSTPSRKTPLGLKVFGILVILGGAIVLPTLVTLLARVAFAFRDGEFASLTAVTIGLIVALNLLLTVTVAAFVVLGVRLVRNRRRGARQTAEAIIVMLIGDALCSLMLTGVQPVLVAFIVAAIILVAMLTYIDPTLSQERELQRVLRDMEMREEAEEGTLGLDKTKRGFIALDFFNLFWIFVIACVIGDVIETAYHFLVVDPGHFQNRTGML